MKNAIESFFWGIIAALGALILEIAIFMGFSMYNNPLNIPSFSQFFTIPIFIIIAALIEELLKYIVISRRIEMMSLEKSYIINSFFVGLGFFGIEILISAMNVSALPAARFLFEIAVIHMGTAGLMGYIIAIKNPAKISTFLYAILITTAFHSFYNLTSVRRVSAENYAIFIVLGILIFINLVNFFRISRKLA